MNPHSYMARLRQIPAACSKVTERGRATHPRGFDPHAPANVSGLVVYLASDASSWLTGQVFRVPRHWPGSFLVSVLSSWLLRGCSRARTQRSYGARIHEIGCDLLLSEIASGGQAARMAAVRGSRAYLAKGRQGEGTLPKTYTRGCRVPLAVV
jgi:hypothetical protein